MLKIVKAIASIIPGRKAEKKAVMAGIDLAFEVYNSLGDNVITKTERELLSNRFWIFVDTVHIIKKE